MRQSYGKRATVVSDTRNGCTRCLWILCNTRANSVIHVDVLDMPADFER